MNRHLKKALLLTSASASLLSLSAVVADVATAGYVSGSASVTNMDGSTYSVGGEIGGIQTNSLVVTPTYTDAGGNAIRDRFTNLNVTGSGEDMTPSQTIAEQVVSVMNSLTSNGTALTDGNAQKYISVIRAAGGADGLE